MDDDEYEDIEWESQWGWKCFCMCNWKQSSYRPEPPIDPDDSMFACPECGGAVEMFLLKSDG
jgi:hypothetical protein